MTVLKRLEDREVNCSAFDLSAIGSLASTEFRHQFGKAPFKIKQKEKFGWFMVAAYPYYFIKSLDSLTDLFLAIPEVHRKETMQAALAHEDGPLLYLDPNATPVKPQKRKRRKRLDPNEKPITKVFTSQDEEQEENDHSEIVKEPNQETLSAEISDVNEEAITDIKEEAHNEVVQEINEGANDETKELD